MRIVNLSIGRRLAVSFVVALLCAAAISVVSVVQMGRISSTLTTVNDVNAVKQRYAINFRGSVHNRAISLRDVVLDSDADYEADIADIATLEQAYTDSEQKLTALFQEKPGTTGEQADVAAIAEVQTRTLPLIEQVVALRRAGDVTGAHDLLLTQARPAFDDWLASINKLIDREEAMNKLASDDARAVADRFRLLISLVFLAGCAVVLVSAWRTTRSIVKPLTEAVQVLGAVADGDLTPRLDASSRDEIGRMSASVNSALAAIGGVVSDLRGRADDLATASRRMSGVSAQLSEGAHSVATSFRQVGSDADQVSGNVDTVATGSGELSRSIEQIAHNAHEAASVAAQAVASAAATTATMRTLDESSRQIGDVVKAITSIAEQTNLLALNATIEAARAGESGKGFAVVAGEVKELAHETAQATDEISRRVATIQAETAGAVAAIAEITAVIERIDAYQATIAEAVEEQATTTAQMNRNVAQAAAGSQGIVSSVTTVADQLQRNEGAAVEASQVAGGLEGVAVELHRLVSRFTV